MGRDVAVKRLREDAIGGHEAQERFAREASALARVSDPYVLAVLDVSSVPGDVYLVTDYCSEGSLADKLRAGRLSAVAARQLIYEVCSGLVALHAAGVIHRDVKPSNIFRLVTRWVIGDLGIARIDGTATLTQIGAVVGTPDYWAPETARAETPTAAVDVYGLGCVLYEALTGHPPFRGVNALATGLLHATAEAPPMPRPVRDADPQLAAVVMRMLAKPAAERPKAAEIARVSSAARRVGDAPTADSGTGRDGARSARRQPARRDDHDWLDHDSRESAPPPAALRVVPALVGTTLANVLRRGRS